MSAQPSRAPPDADADTADFHEQADALVDPIVRLLAGKPPELQGAVLADLTAIWVAGHRVGPGGRAEGDRVREELLELQTKHVRELVAMYLEGVDG